MGRYVDVRKLKIQRIVFDGAIYDCVPMNALFEMAVENVEPVVHAHWKEFEDYGGNVYPECSRCGLVWWLEEGTAEENEMYYCPKCGAKMDEEV